MAPTGPAHRSVYRFASAIATELSAPPKRIQLMRGSKSSWFVPEVEPNDDTFELSPEDSLAEWHQRRGLVR